MKQSIICEFTFVYASLSHKLANHLLTLSSSLLLACPFSSYLCQSVYCSGKRKSSVAQTFLTKHLPLALSAAVAVLVSQTRTHSWPPPAQVVPLESLKSQFQANRESGSLRGTGWLYTTYLIIYILSVFLFFNNIFFQNCIAFVVFSVLLSSYSDIYCP